MFVLKRDVKLQLTNLLPVPLVAEGTVLIAVCLFVCLSVSEMTQKARVDFREVLEIGPQKSWLTFGRLGLCLGDEVGFVDSPLSTTVCFC